MDNCYLDLYYGSPPRMRGKEQPETPHHGAGRITPAYAGKRESKQDGHTITWDHPRTCGEKALKHKEELYELGSPPHMRGKDRFVIDVYTEVRITPAHAGKRLAAPDARRTVWDHPRACGEKHSCINLGQHKRGSPPRMRGKDVKLTLDAGKLRITPAHAGKSSLRLALPCLLKDHPRACGEK